MFRAGVIALTLLLAGPGFAADAPVRDPMRPFGAVVEQGSAGSAAGAPRFSLTGVLIAPTRRVAILNGKPYAEGAMVDGAEIVAIEPGVVRLRDNGAELVIALGRTTGGASLPPAQGERVQ